MANLRLNINLDNDSIVSGHESLSDILRNLAQELDDNPRSYGSVRDINGNSIGSYTVDD